MSEPIQPPTPLARRFVRLLVGFGVGVGVGAAPFLGTVDVPLFEQLVDVFPNEGRNRLFAFGAFAMGLVAVAVQFYSGETPSRRRVRQLFSRTLAVILVALAALGVLVVKFVYQKDTAGGIASFVLVGERLATCECEAPTNEACLNTLNANPDVIATCWDPDAAENVELALTGAYLLLTGGFGALIGLLLLQGVAQRQAATRRAARPRRRRKPRREGGEPPPKPSADAG